MAVIRYLLLSCILASLANKINASLSSIQQGTKDGRAKQLGTYVMPSSQQEYILNNLEEKCKPYKLVGVTIKARSSNGMSVYSLNPWGARFKQMGYGSDIFIDTTIYCL